jgi:hypothetical protein
VSPPRRRTALLAVVSIAVVATLAAIAIPGTQGEGSGDPGPIPPESAAHSGSAPPDPSETPRRDTEGGSPKAQTGMTALLVVGSAADLNESEVAIRARLSSRGYLVDVVEDVAAHDVTPDNYAIVLLSKTIESAVAGATYRDAAVGVLFWEDNAQASAMLATIDDSSQLDTAWHTETAVVEVDRAAPLELRAGLAGEVQLLRSADEVTYAPVHEGRSTLGAEAIRVARLASDDDRWVYYAFEAGLELADGSRAAGRRVYFGLYDDTYRLLTLDGQLLFDAAVDWAAGRGRN